MAEPLNAEATPGVNLARCRLFAARGTGLQEADAENPLLLPLLLLPPSGEEEGEEEDERGEGRRVMSAALAEAVDDDVIEVTEEDV